MIFRCVVPVENHVVKKNGRSIFMNKATGRMFPGKSNKLVQAENHLVKEFREAWWRHGPEDRKPIDYPINIMFLFYFNEKEFYTKKGLMSKHIADLSNLYQLPEDCLQKAKIIDNDHYISGHDGSRRLSTLDQNYLEIIISKC
jgi:Holliday junction resolvase RusA-like endonuclease